MFAALSQYEQRFQNIERIISRNAQLLERMDRDSVAGAGVIRELRRILTVLESLENLKENDEEKIEI